MPCKVVVQIFCRDTVKTAHELLELTMVAVDVLDIINAFLGFSGFELNKRNAIGFSKPDIRVELVSHKDCVAFNSTVIDSMQVFCGNAPCIRNSGDRQTGSIHRARDAYFCLGKASDMRRMPTLIRLARHFKTLTFAMVSLI